MSQQEDLFSFSEEPFSDTEKNTLHKRLRKLLNNLQELYRKRRDKSYALDRFVEGEYIFDYNIIDIESNGRSDLFVEIVNFARIHLATYNSESIQKDQNWPFRASSIQEIYVQPSCFDADTKKKFQDKYKYKEWEPIQKLWDTLDYLQDTVLIAHNAEFDYELIARNLEFLEKFARQRPDAYTNRKEPAKIEEEFHNFLLKKYKDFSILVHKEREGFAKIIDTLDLAHLLFPGEDKHDLTSLAKRLYVHEGDFQKLFPHYFSQKKQQKKKRSWKDLELERAGKNPKTYVGKRHEALYDAMLLSSVLSKVVAWIGSPEPQYSWLMELLPEEYLLKKFMRDGFFPTGFGVIPSDKKTNPKEKFLDFLKDKIPKNGFEKLRKKKEEKDKPELQEIPEHLKKKYGRDFGSEILPEEAIGILRWHNREKPQAGGKGRSGKQYQIIEALSRLLSEPSLGMIEAGTGTGKTLGYLLPAIRRLQLTPKARIIISTHTKALQKQVAEEIESLRGKIHNIPKPPDIARYDPPEPILKELNYIIVKGKRNYVCMSRLLDKIFDANGQIRNTKETKIARDRVYFVMLLARYMELPPSIADDLEEVPAHINKTFNPSGILEEEINYHPLESDCTTCDFRDHCLLILRTKELIDPKNSIVIANDSLLMSEHHTTQEIDDENRKPEGEEEQKKETALEGEELSYNISFPQVLRNIASTAIFDEAHHLEDTYRHVNAKESTHADFEAILGRYRKATSKLRRVIKKIQDMPLLQKSEELQKDTSDCLHFIDKHKKKIAAFQKGFAKEIARFLAEENEESLHDRGRLLGFDEKTHNLFLFLKDHMPYSRWFLGIHKRLLLRILGLYDLFESIEMLDHEIPRKDTLDLDERNRYKKFLAFLNAPPDEFADPKPEPPYIEMQLSEASPKEELFGLTKFHEKLSRIYQQIENIQQTYGRKVPALRTIRTQLEGIEEDLKCIDPFSDSPWRAKSNTKASLANWDLLGITKREAAKKLLFLLLKKFKDQNTGTLLLDYRLAGCSLETYESYYQEAYNSARAWYNWLVWELQERDIQKQGFSLREEYNYNYDIAILGEKKALLEEEEEAFDFEDGSSPQLFSQEKEPSKRPQPLQGFRIQRFEIDISQKIKKKIKGFWHVALLSASFLLQKKGNTKDYQNSFFVKRLGLADQLFSDDRWPDGKTRNEGAWLGKNTGLQVIKISSPFVPAKQMQVYVPYHIPPPTGHFREEHLRDSLLESLRLLSLLPLIPTQEENKGRPEYKAARALFLFTSWENLKVHEFFLKENHALFPDTPEEPEVRIFVQGENTKQELKKNFGDFRKYKKAALFGLQSYGEGFDILQEYYGDLKCERVNPIKLLCLNKLPLLNMNDPILQSQYRALETSDELKKLNIRIIQNAEAAGGHKPLQDSQGAEIVLGQFDNPGNAWFGFYLPKCQVFLQQWVGRLLRTRKDQGMVFILDPRILEERYSPLLIEAIEGYGEADAPVPIHYYGKAYAKAQNQYFRNEDAAYRRWLESLPDEQKIDLTKTLPFQKAMRLPSPFAEFQKHPPRCLPEAKIHQAMQRAAVRLPAELPHRIRFLENEFHNSVLDPWKKKISSKPVLALFHRLQGKGDAQDHPLLGEKLQHWILKQHSPKLFSDIQKDLKEKRIRHWNLEDNIEKLNKKTEQLVRLWELQSGKTFSHLYPRQDALADELRRQFRGILQDANLQKKAAFQLLANGQPDVLSQVPVLFNVYGRSEDAEGRQKGADISLFVMPTGLGKSLCYQIPALLGMGLTLVFEPTISLIEDQIRGLMEAAPEVMSGLAAFHGKSNGKTTVLKRLADADVRLRLLYLHPSSLRNSHLFALLLQHPHIERIVFDEVHSLLDWGNSFMQDYNLVCAFQDRYKSLHPDSNLRIFGFTATIIEENAKEIIRRIRHHNKNLLGDPVGQRRKPKLASAQTNPPEKQKEHEFHRALMDRPDIFLNQINVEVAIQKIQPEEALVDDFEKRIFLLKHLLLDYQPTAEKKVLIYCHTAGISGENPQGVEQVYDSLFIEGTKELLELKRKTAKAYSALLQDEDYKAALYRKPILISTSVLGMGVNISDVRAVVFFDLPESPELFVQVMGRMRTQNKNTTKELHILYCNGAYPENDWPTRRPAPTPAYLKNYAPFAHIAPSNSFQYINCPYITKFPNLPPRLLNHEDFSVEQLPQETLLDCHFHHYTQQMFLGRNEVNKSATADLVRKLFWKAHYNSKEEFAILYYLPTPAAMLSTQDYEAQKELVLRREEVSALWELPFVESLKTLHHPWHTSYDTGQLKLALELIEKQVLRHKDWNLRSRMDLYLGPRQEVCEGTSTPIENLVAELAEPKKVFGFGRYLIDAIELLCYYNCLGSWESQSYPVVRLRPVINAPEQGRMKIDFTKAVEPFVEIKNSWAYLRSPGDWAKGLERKNKYWDMFENRRCLRASLIELFSPQEAELIRKIQASKYKEGFYPHGCCSHCNGTRLPKIQPTLFSERS